MHNMYIVVHDLVHTFIVLTCTPAYNSRYNECLYSNNFMNLHLSSWKSGCLYQCDRIMSLHMTINIHFRWLLYWNVRCTPSLPSIWVLVWWRSSCLEGHQTHGVDLMRQNLNKLTPLYCSLVSVFSYKNGFMYVHVVIRVFVTQSLLHNWLGCEDACTNNAMDYPLRNTKILLHSWKIPGILAVIQLLR